MKANELSTKDLMEGDWVYGIFSGCPQERITMKYSICSNSYEWKYMPIPLTAEILKKNGFYYDEDRKAYLMGVIFQVKPEKYGLFSFEICGCSYPLNTVHELQHALRLCGIEKEIIL